MRFSWFNSLKNIWQPTWVKISLFAGLALFFVYEFFWKQFSLEQPDSESAGGSGITILVEDLLEFFIDTAANIWSTVRPYVDPDNWNLGSFTEGFPRSLWETPSVLLGLGVFILILFLAVIRARRTRAEKRKLQEELQAVLDEEELEEGDRPLFPLAPERTLSTNDMDWDEPEQSDSTELDFKNFEKSIESLPEPDNDDERLDSPRPEEKIISITEALPSPPTPLSGPEDKPPPIPLKKQPDAEEVFLGDLEDEITAAAQEHGQTSEDETKLEDYSLKEEEQFHQENLKQESEVISSIQEETYLEEEMSPEDKLLKKLETDFREWENLAQTEKNRSDKSIAEKNIKENTVAESETRDQDHLKTEPTAIPHLPPDELKVEKVDQEVTSEPVIEISHEAFLKSSPMEKSSDPERDSEYSPEQEDSLDQYEQSISKLQLEMDETFKELSGEIDQDKSGATEDQIEPISPELPVIENRLFKRPIEKIKLEPEPEPVAETRKKETEKKSDTIINRLETFQNKLEKGIIESQPETNLPAKPIYSPTKTCSEGTNGKHPKCDDNLKILESFIWTEKQKMIEGTFSKTQ